MVMTRQPAAEKRFTVAWPIPREAPESSRTRRGELEACGRPAPLIDMSNRSTLFGAGIARMASRHTRPWRGRAVRPVV
jgi:hypothetical protein